MSFVLVHKTKKRAISFMPIFVVPLKQMADLLLTRSEPNVQFSSYP